MGSPKKVCIIGAGSSGIPVIKALSERGVDFDCYEKSSRVGGNWVFRNTNGMSAAYRSLHINTSRDRMQYADFPMPRDYPDFAHHSLLAEYFQSYVDHFDLSSKIRFETLVERADRKPGGGWRVRLDDGSEHEYDFVVVANGHHWDPRWPDPAFPGEFDGAELHAHSYIDPDEPESLRGKRVVVVGMGNSAMDIACELSHRGVAEKVFLSGRRGAWVIPHYFLGKPLDQSSALPSFVPARLRAWMNAAIFERVVGKMSDFGLPEPDHRLGEAHPTISSELLAKMGRGDIEYRPNIERLEGGRVRFVDGRVERVDAIIYCTGYKVSFPFFDPQLIGAPDNELPLYMHVFDPDLDDVCFVGLMQPLGAIMPIAERQAKWIAEHLVGACPLPSSEAMKRHIDVERRAMRARYIPSARHTMQADFDDYMDELSAEMKAGRARSGGRR